MTIIEEIFLERANQISKGYTDEKDDSHTIMDFTAIIEHQTFRADHTYTASEVRARFVKIAAVAVAAISSIDRTGTAKRY